MLSGTMTLNSPFSSAAAGIGSKLGGSSLLDTGKAVAGCIGANLACMLDLRSIGAAIEDAICASGNDLNKSDSVLGAVMGAISVLSNSKGAACGVLSDSLSGLGGMSPDMAKSALNSGLGAAGEVIDVACNTSAGMLGSALSGVTGANMIQCVAGDVGGMISGLIGGIADLGKSLLGGFGSFFDNMPDFGGLLGDFFDGIAGVAETIFAIVGSFLGYLTSFVEPLIEMALDIAGMFLGGSGIRANLSGILDGEAFKHSMNGLFDGDLFSRINNRPKLSTSSSRIPGCR